MIGPLPGSDTLRCTMAPVAFGFPSSVKGWMRGKTSAKSLLLLRNEKTRKPLNIPHACTLGTAADLSQLSACANGTSVGTNSSASLSEVGERAISVALH